MYVHAYLFNSSFIPPLHVQIVVEEFLEDINNILNSGEVSVLTVHKCVITTVGSTLCMNHVMKIIRHAKLIVE